MDLPDRAFTFPYEATTMHFGPGCVSDLGAMLEEAGIERPLIVCGTNVGANPDTMDPVRDGVGDRLVDVFDETTPEKTLTTVLDGVERMAAVDADGLVALGGGSSLNVARGMAALDTIDASRETLRSAVLEEEAIQAASDRDPVPMVTVPTTLTGADVSSGGTIRLAETATAPPGEGDHDEELFSVRVSDPRLFPAAICYDQALFASTPLGALINSAMNGFNKGIETLYSRETNPISDAHAYHGLRHLAAGLGELTEADGDAEHPAYDHLVAGVPLVQYGRFTNIIHTFGNGINHHYDVQQGVAHGIMAPPVLEFVFDRVDGRRSAIAEALELDTEGREEDAIAEAIVDRVRSIREALGLPARLRSIDGLERAHLPALAEVIASNPKQARNPPGIDPDATAIEEILTAAW